MRMLGILKTERQYFESMVDNILEFVRRAKKIHDTTKGTTNNSNVYDGSALAALNLWADGMYGYLCSPQIDWFSLKLPVTIEFPRWSTMRAWNGKKLDDIPEVAQWLSYSTEVMRAALLRSNFYAQMPQFFRDGGSVGTAAMSAEENPSTGKINFNPMHFREYYLSESCEGEIDTIYRSRKFNLRQLVQKFGIDALLRVDINFKQQLESNPYQDRTLIHAVYPRTDRDASAKDNKNKPWASVWMLEGNSQKVIKESGMTRFPYVTWRYRKETDEVYGRGPAWDAYTEIMTGNQQGKSNLTAGHKMADPAMIGLVDLRGAVNKLPGGWTWVDRMSDQPLPLQTGIQLPFSLEMQDRTRKAIEKHFNVDFFLMLSEAAYNKVNLTATQVIQMAGEKAAVLATRTDTLNVEAFNPIIDLVFDIEWQAGRIPPPPNIVLEFSPDGHIEVDYLGPLAQAQKTLFQSQGIRAGMEIAAQVGQVFPESLIVIDPVETMKEALRATGFPAKAMRTDDQMAQIAEQQRRAQVAEQQMQSGERIAKMLPLAGKAIEAGSPLAALAGQGGENG